MNFKPIYKIPSFINLNELEKYNPKAFWNKLSLNPNAIHILEQNLDKVDWISLSRNSNAISMLKDIIKNNNNWSSLFYSKNIINVLHTNKQKEMNSHMLSSKFYSNCTPKNSIWYCCILNNPIWYYLSGNPNAIELLEKNLDKVDWRALSSNPNAIDLLEKNLEKVNWDILSYSNSNAISLLEKNLNKVDWSMLSANPNAIHFLEQNLDKVDWYWLSGNPNAIHLLEQNLDKVDWNSILFRNPNAIHLLEQNLDKVNWSMLSSNPNAIPILEKNLSHINWNKLSSNPNAIHILEQNLDRVDWYSLLKCTINVNVNILSIIHKGYDLMTLHHKIHMLANPNIFILDIEKMRTQCKPFCEELCKYVFSPRRVMRSIELFNYHIVSDDIWENI